MSRTAWPTSPSSLASGRSPSHGPGATVRPAHVVHGSAAGTDRGAAAHRHPLDLSLPPARVPARCGTWTHPNHGGGLHLCAGAGRTAGSGVAGPRAQSLRPAGSLRPRFRPGGRRARVADTLLPPAARQAAAVPGDLRLPCGERVLRADRMGRRAGPWARTRTSSSARKAILGTRNGTCSWRSSARWSRWRCSLADTTARSRG